MLLAMADDEFEEWVRIDGGRVHQVVRWLTVWLWDIFFRLKTYGVENIPAQGAFLMCPNHSSYGDPFFQARGQGRLVRFMAKDSMFDWPFIGRIVRAGGGFPVRRGRGDTFAIELAERLLADGQPVVIYPEGTRFRDDPLGPPRRGAARVALRSGVPVIPVATYGAKPRRSRGKGWFPPSLPRVTTIYGPPINFAGLDFTPENVDRVRDEIWEHVQRLYDLARTVNSRRRRPRTLAVPG